MVAAYTGTSVLMDAAYCFVIPTQPATFKTEDRFEIVTYARAYTVLLRRSNKTMPNSTCRIKRHSHVHNSVVHARRIASRLLI